MLYAAYGSNLLPARLLARVPEAALVGTCRIPGRRLAFHLASLDGSGKCDIPPAPGDGHCVRAALYRMDEPGWARLDTIEGVGISYVRLGLRIQDSPEAGMAEAYVAVEGRTDGGLRPYAWYKRLVLEGARYHGFPTDYLESIAGVPSAPDPDRSRARRNLVLLESLEEQG